MLRDLDFSIHHSFYLSKKIIFSENYIVNILYKNFSQQIVISQL